MKESLYILDDKMKIYHIEDEDGMKFHIKNTFDFTGSNKLKQVLRLRDIDWSHVHITRRAITFDGDTYNLKSNLTSPLIIPKSYFGEKDVETEQ